MVPLEGAMSGGSSIGSLGTDRRVPTAGGLARDAGRCDARHTIRASRFLEERGSLGGASVTWKLSTGTAFDDTTAMASPVGGIS